MPHRVDDQIEAVNAVEHPHVEGGGEGALLPVAQYVDVLVVPAVGQLVHQGGVAVEGEDDGLVPGKDHVVILVGEPVGGGGVGPEGM